VHDGISPRGGGVTAPVQDRESDRRATLREQYRKDSLAGRGRRDGDVEAQLAEQRGRKPIEYSPCSAGGTEFGPKTLVPRGDALTAAVGPGWVQ
jgi:hypothetical protein